MWYFFCHVGVAIFHLFVCIFVAQNGEVKCDKGKLPVKVESVSISLDDLVAEKIGGPSFGRSSKTNTQGGDGLKGNLHYLFPLSLCLCTTFFPSITCFFLPWLF